MNDVERAKLVEAFAECWPTTGPRARVWHEILGPLEHAAAHRAYLRLRDTASRASVAEFLTLYRDVLAETRAPDPPCKYCDGTGWITAPTLGRHGQFQAAPCPSCEAGKRAAAVHRRILDERAQRVSLREVEDVQSELL